MRLAITRPEPDATPLAKRLLGLGHEVVMEPLLTLKFDDEIGLPPERFQAGVFTSANGVRAMATRDNFSSFQTMPAYTVGAASADAARQAGFTDVISADGDLEDLERKIKRSLDPHAGPLLYATGEEVSGDLAGTLRAQGFRVNRVVLYSAIPAEKLSIGVRVLIEEGSLDAVLLFSRRTATIWADLVEKAGLVEFLRGTRHFCLSGPIGDLLRERFGFAVPHIVIARRPETDSLLDLLEG